MPGYLGGPFEDRTGGITFEAKDGDRARRAVDADPFVREGLLEVHWLKQVDARMRSLRPPRRELRDPAAGRC